MKGALKHPYIFQHILVMIKPLQLLLFYTLILSIQTLIASYIISIIYCTDIYISPQLDTNVTQSIHLHISKLDTNPYSILYIFSHILQRYIYINIAGYKCDTIHSFLHFQIGYKPLQHPIYFLTYCVDIYISPQLVTNLIHFIHLCISKLETGPYSILYIFIYILCGYIYISIAGYKSHTFHSFMHF